MVARFVRGNPDSIVISQCRSQVSDLRFQVETTVGVSPETWDLRPETNRVGTATRPINTRGARPVTEKS